MEKMRLGHAMKDDQNRSNLWADIQVGSCGKILYIYYVKPSKK